MSKVSLGDNMDLGFVMQDQQEVEKKSIGIESVVGKVISKYSFDLDSIVSEINERIKEQELDGFSDQDIESYCLKLSTFMYFSAAGQELIGLREAIANALYKEEYNNNYSSSEGTIADKKASAELESQSSMIVGLIYDRAEKMMESKLTYATHLLGSLKRILNRRIEQMKMNPSTVKYKDETIGGIV